MTVKSILPFGDPILRKTVKPVTEITAKIIKILDDLAETLYDGDGRAGFAAPQVGFLRRLVVMDCEDGLIELINPEIIEMEGEQLGTEACLSFPGYFGNVKRAQTVVIKTLNRQGEPLIIKGEGFTARCIQQEIDHLNGILFVDHVEDDWPIHEQTEHKINLKDVIRLTYQE